jgi:hypothetical protein
MRGPRLRRECLQRATHMVPAAWATTPTMHISQDRPILGFLSIANLLHPAVGFAVFEKIARHGNRHARGVGFGVGRTLGTFMTLAACLGRLSVSNQQPAADTGEVTDVQRAVRLGWRFAEMYRSPPPSSHPPTNVAGSLKHLPAVFDLDDFDRSTLLVGQIEHDVRTLAERSVNGEGTKTWEPIEKAIDEARAGASEADKRQSILKAYRELRIKLGASDPRIGTALDLGQVLADTVLMPASSDSAAIMEKFSDPQLSYAPGWLDDLHMSLSEHAADAVKGSLQSWLELVKKTNGIIADRERANLIQSLHNQGEIWHRILCGEMRAEDLLTSESYRKAAVQMLNRLRSLSGSFLGRWWWAVVSLLAMVGLATWGVVVYSPGGATAIAALIATGAGALGISWKTISSTLGKVTSKAEGPLWDTEVLQAVIAEATLTPGSARARRNALSNANQVQSLSAPAETPATGAGTAPASVPEAEASPAPEAASAAPTSTASGAPAN